MSIELIHVMAFYMVLMFSSKVNVPSEILINTSNAVEYAEPKVFVCLSPKKLLFIS